MDHDVDDLQIAQIEHAAEHVRVALAHRAFLLRQLDRAAQLLVAGEDVGGVVDLARRQLEELADDEGDAIVNGVSSTMSQRMIGASSRAARSGLASA